ncbi:Peptidyl-prolyl cis-trans isomerase FKBP13 [Morus notabilis]|uniref:peptidylprolyl isomerase n=1 Tax=Morus notabilis TaxID=981085 RepID=W9RD73_9ROSA|nr:peptidyl-prolyl cis-trans isomerase FKBP13, chloroplastic [Morus notabilis]EXB83251.1 Peptidyl-prolyl cis-trans isomerase FKBP13 [Morus notabilis]
MSSSISYLASSVGTTCNCKPSRSVTNNFYTQISQNTTTTSSLMIVTSTHDVKALSSYKQKQLQLKEKVKPGGLFGRREALAIIGGGGGFGLSFGILELLLHPSHCEAAPIEGGGGPCEFSVAPSGLAFCDKVVGYGAEPVKGQLIKAHYVGKLENGKVFDSSYNRGKPLTFRIGVGEVIKGWDEGILGGDGIPPMLAGGKRVLKLPPELGYGVRGAGCRGGSCIIPPNSVLLFDVEFIGKA